MKDFAVSIVGGCTIGFLCTLLFNFFISLFPDLKPAGISSVALLLGMENYSPIHYFVIVYLVLLAPIAEEYIFRGVMWQFFEAVFNKKIAYLLMTTVFCLVHAEFLHIISILPLSLFFGWLRYHSGKIHLPILAHIANNILATVIFIC